MTKEELVRLLEPFTGDIEIHAVLPGGKRLPIFGGAYHNDKGDGLVDLFVDGSGPTVEGKS